MKVGGIVLCGGQSRRMGMPKASLPFGPELMIQRVLRLLGTVVERIVVVAAEDQELPPLPPSVTVVRDREQGRGPLEGLHAGLSAMAEVVDVAYATGCDVPLLVPAFVQRMIDLAEHEQIVVPVDTDGRFHHPLAAVYRTDVAREIRKLLDADRLRPIYLFDCVKTRKVPVEALQDVDPDLATLRNLNYPDDYRAALAHAGFEPTADVLGHLARWESQRRPGKVDFPLPSDQGDER